jgi:dsRNA-specific ribonuclease
MSGWSSLGDAVLNFVVSVRLADTFLSMAGQPVPGTHDWSVGIAGGALLGLGQYLRLGHGEEDRQEAKPHWSPARKP